VTPAFLAAAVERAVRTRRFRYSNEADLQRGLAQAFEADGLVFEREVEIGGDGERFESSMTGMDLAIAEAEWKLRRRGRDRVDFLVGQCVAVEVKVDGSIGEVTRQLHRYAQSVRVLALVLISTKTRLDNLPAQLNGKPLRVAVLPGGFL
jgi:hypothetical protein